MFFLRLTCLSSVRTLAHRYPFNHHRTFLPLRHDQDISYDGIRREGIPDSSHALVPHRMTIVLDAIPRSGFSVYSPLLALQTTLFTEIPFRADTWD